MTSIMSSDFHFLVSERFYTKFGSDHTTGRHRSNVGLLAGAVVSGKILFEFLYIHNLGPRSRNDLDLHNNYMEGSGSATIR